MIYTIQNIKNKLELYEGNRKLTSLNGYAFIDEKGHCIIIVYSEKKRDLVKKYLEGEIGIENKTSS